MINIEELPDHQREYWERFTSFKDRFFKESGMTQFELVNEHISDRDMWGSMTFRLPSFEYQRRNLSLTFVEGPSPYVEIFYSQLFKDSAPSIDEFKEGCDLLNKHYSQIEAIVQGLLDDLPGDIIQNDYNFKDKGCNVVQRKHKGEYPYALQITLLSGEEVSIDRAKALGQIEDIINGFSIQSKSQTPSTK